MPTRTRPAAAALLLAVGGLSGCVDTGPTTAYCGPGEPVLTPAAVGPGDELRVEVAGAAAVDGCEQGLPHRARYEIRLTSERFAHGAADRPYTATLGALEPGADGGAVGTVHLPDDVPPGDAEVSVHRRRDDLRDGPDDAVRAGPLRVPRRHRLSAVSRPRPSPRSRRGSRACRAGSPR